MKIYEAPNFVNGFPCFVLTKVLLTVLVVMYLPGNSDAV